MVFAGNVPRKNKLFEGKLFFKQIKISLPNSTENKFIQQWEVTL
jgi:hypothetical protein